MSSGNTEVYARLFKLQAAVSKLVVDGNRDPYKVADALQAIVDEPQVKDEAPVDNIIYPYCSVSIEYPDWVARIKFSYLEDGPVEYDGKEIRIESNTNGQSASVMTGGAVLDCVAVTGIQSCLGLRDALAIQRKGFPFFHRIFGRRSVMCWRSTVENSAGKRFAPYIQGLGGVVAIGWFCLNNVLPSDFVTARYPLK